MKDYHTKTEALHIKLLENMGFTVINPSGPRYEKKVKNLKAEGKTSSEIMDYFVEVVKNCDHLAFSTTKDGKLVIPVSTLGNPHEYLNHSCNCHCSFVYVWNNRRIA
jgi:hypothetical protein